jgi:23S rRNA methylase
MLGGPVDAVLSDMAPNSSGHAPTDHLKIMLLCEVALELAEEIFGTRRHVFFCKTLQGGDEKYAN